MSEELTTTTRGVEVGCTEGGRLSPYKTVRMLNLRGKRRASSNGGGQAQRGRASSACAALPPAFLVSSPQLACSSIGLDLALVLLASIPSALRPSPAPTSPFPLSRSLNIDLIPSSNRHLYHQQQYGAMCTYVVSSPCTSPRQPRCPLPSPGDHKAAVDKRPVHESSSAETTSAGLGKCSDESYCIAEVAQVAPRRLRKLSKRPPLFFGEGASLV